MNQIIAALIIAVCLLQSHVGLAQGVTGSQTAQDTVDVQHVLDAFHEAVVKHDGDRLSALFLPEGSLWVKVLSDAAYARIMTKSPPPAKLQVSSYRDFAKFVSNSTAKLDPQHTHVQIHSDGTIASVYFDFVFMIDGKAENRGSETWQLVKAADGWRIVAITYSADPKA